jgi:peptide/nickel transport system ATP-binding protein
VQSIRRKSISMIFQDPTASLNPVFKIGEQLLDIIKYSSKAAGKSLTKQEMNEQAVDALKMVALPDPERILQNYPIQLSGGMRQRVCIAAALISAGDLLIADEPGTSLDVTIEDQILRLLGNIVKDRGTSIILISHALGAVKGLVDKVYVMYAGNMIEVARTQDLFSNPLHPYTSNLFKTVPKITGGGVPEPIPGRIPDYFNPPQGCRFCPRCKQAMPICEKDTPSFRDQGNDHEVACFLYP